MSMRLPFAPSTLILWRIAVIIIDTEGHVAHALEDIYRCGV
jgi:hypothetical protein